ncbi:MAG TPA: hypothetical protein G4O07_03585 [Dehalococcoidia bacterium]|nr:hypothetical protein [Dehalococcoidia bacterium]
MIAQIAAWAAVTIFFGLICFQMLLALGLPFGKAAWGGKYRILPPGFRIASLFSAVVYIFVSIIVLEKAEAISVIDNLTAVTYITWIFTAFLGLNTISNFISRSKLEKRIMTPVSLTLALLCFIVAFTSG